MGLGGHRVGIARRCHLLAPRPSLVVAAGVQSIEHGYGLDEGASTWPRRFLGAAASADIVTYHHDPRKDPTSSPGRPPSWPAGSGCAKRIRRRSLLYAFADTSWWRLLNDLLDVVDEG